MKSAEQIIAKEQTELTKLKAKLDRKKYAGFLAILFLLVIAIHIIDEITTNVSGYVQSSIVTEFFVNGRGLSYNEGLASLSSVTGIFMIFQIISPFYKSLADRFGRKPFLVINVLGMSVGLLFCFFSTNFLMYCIGAGLCSFFIAHDMQVVYILEVAPENKRATFYGVTKCIGTIGLALVPLFRNIFMGNDPTQWRMVFLVPVIIGLAVAIFALIAAREPDAYLKQRIAYLERPLSEREAEKKAKKSESKTNKAGVFSAIKHIFSSKDFRWLLISAMVFYLGVIGLSSYYESIMMTNGMSTEEITQALFVYPFVFAAIILLCGFLGDGIGRKKTVVIMGGVSLIGFILFVMACRNLWSPLVVGLLYGIYLSCYFQAGDYLGMMCAEKAPTEIRASVSGGFALLLFASILLGMVLNIVLMLVVPDIATVCMIISIPCVIIGILIMLLKVKETKGVKLDEVGHE